MTKIIVVSLMLGAFTWVVVDTARASHEDRIESEQEQWARQQVELFIQCERAWPKKGKNYDRCIKLVKKIEMLRRDI